MEQKIKNRLMCLLASFMVITSACSDNKSDIYVGQTPFGKNMANSSIVTEMYWDRSVALRDGVTITELFFRTGQYNQHVYVAGVDLTKVTFTPGTKDDKNVPAVDENSDAILPYHAYAAEQNGKKVWLGVNGDFYTAKYEVMGIFFKDTSSPVPACSASVQSAWNTPPSDTAQASPTPDLPATAASGKIEKCCSSCATSSRSCAG